MADLVVGYLFRHLDLIDKRITLYLPTQCLSSCSLRFGRMRARSTNDFCARIWSGRDTGGGQKSTDRPFFGVSLAVTAAAAPARAFLTAQVHNDHYMSITDKPMLVLYKLDL